MKRAAALSTLALTAALLAGCGSDSDTATEPMNAPISGDASKLMTAPPAGAPAMADMPGMAMGQDTPVLACAGLDTPLKGAPAAAPAKGDKLPDLSFECLGGGAPVKLSDLRGPLLLNVWASWCLPCADEIPYLTAAHQSLGDKVRFAGVALTDQDPDSKAWLSFHGVDWPSLADPKGAVRGPMKIPGPPVTLFVNSDGTITEVHYGAFTSARQVQDAIAEHLGVT